ncbi:MAG: glycosyltransferase [Prolixibacteraceae bacterium]|nr:glycosyltransferase [Prolixibacteraceae bacterium]
MKILFVIDTLGSGGKERRLTELLKALKSHQEIDFELVLMSENIHYKEINYLGIKIHKVIRKTKRDISVFNKFYCLLRYHKPDIVHCWDSMTAVYMAPVARLLGCRLINGMVIDVPTAFKIFNKHWIRGRLTFPLSKAVVGNSGAGLEAYCVPANKRVLIYNGFNFSRLENLVPGANIIGELNITTELVVGMVATFWKRKDYPTYYEAAQTLLKKRSDVTFLAIGVSTDSEESLNLVEHEYRPYFRFLGAKTNVESYINIMDIGVLTTFSEGISNAVLEYMALGKPVIATGGSGTAEIIQDGITGILVDASDPVHLAEKLEILLNDSFLRERMGLAGRERVREHFSINRMVGEYIDLYKRIT